MKKERRKDVLISFAAASVDSHDQKGQKSRNLLGKLAKLILTTVLKTSKLTNSIVAKQKSSSRFLKKY